MKIYHIAIFMFIFLNMMVFLGETLDFAEKPTAQSWAMEKAINASYKVDTSNGLTAEAMVQMAIATFMSIGALLFFLLQTTVLLPDLLNDFGILRGSAFNLMITGVVWITYAAAVVQLWGNRRIGGG